MHLAFGWITDDNWRDLLLLRCVSGSLMKSEVFLIGSIFVNKRSVLRGCFQTFLGMLTFLLRRDCWKLFRMLELHIFSLHIYVPPVLWGTLLYKVILVCVYWNCSGREKEVSCQLLFVKSQFWSTTPISYYFWSIFLFAFGAFYHILCKASVAQYSAFPRDPRKCSFIICLSEARSWHSWVVYLWMGSPPFLHTAKASATSYLPRVMTAQLCSWWWKADFVPSRFYLGWYFSLTI